MGRTPQAGQTGGETVTVQKLQGEGPVKRRIMDMGITKGLGLMCERWRLWEIRWRSRCGAMKASLRKGDADMILVE